MTTIYFDYNATTPLDPTVSAAMVDCQQRLYGNPSSPHRVGMAARACLDDCRHRVAQALACRPGEIAFTSGGTESNNLAVFAAVRARQSRGRHLITSPTEHHSVLRCFEYLAEHEGFQLTLLPVDSDGLIDPASLRQAMRDDTILVSIMAANNETGTLQPIAALGELCRQRDVLFHTDAVHVFGKLPWTAISDFQADLVTGCAHKFHGPKGIGFLYQRSPLRLPPVLHGGAQEDERRPGTENLAAIVGLTLALERTRSEPVFPPKLMQDLAVRLMSLVQSVPGVQLVSAGVPRLPNTISFTVQGCDNEALLAALDLEGICASGGSACSTGALVPSHVLRALGYSATQARSFIRFSLGRENSVPEVETVGRLLPSLIGRVRAANIPVKNRE